MFIGNSKRLRLNPEGIICLIPTLLTYNPFGIEENSFESFYKHKFPSGMGDKLRVRHKADNSEILLNPKNIKNPTSTKKP